jgi:hypothetical protein
MAKRGRTQARYIRRLQKALVELRTDAERREVLRVEALKRAVTAESELAVLKAAARAVAAEREAHEQTRAERDRACAEQVVAHACMVKAFSAKLEAEAERDAALTALARLDGLAKP